MNSIKSRLVGRNFNKTMKKEVIIPPKEPNKTTSRRYVCNKPLDGTHLVAVRGLTTKRLSTQERQREELVGAALLRPIRTNRSSLTCRCQFPDSR